MTIGCPYNHCQAAAYGMRPRPGAITSQTTPRSGRSGLVARPRRLPRRDGLADDIDTSLNAGFGKRRLAIDLDQGVAYNKTNEGAVVGLDRFRRGVEGGRPDRQCQLLSLVMA
jgi:hypothetical protein